MWHNFGDPIVERGEHFRTVAPKQHEPMAETTRPRPGKESLGAIFPFNGNRALDYGLTAARYPRKDRSVRRGVAPSAVTERTASEKVGSGAPTIGNTTAIGHLDPVRVDATECP